MKKVTITQDEYDSLLSTISELERKNLEQKHTIDHLTEKLALHRGYGKSSEKKVDPNQIAVPDVFNEAEALVDVSLPESKTEEVFTEVKGHVRKKTYLKDQLPDDIPVEEHHHSMLKDGDTCPICRYQLVKFGTKQYEHIKIIPAKVILMRDIIDVYKCSHCKETSGETVIKEAERPVSVIPGSLATAEAIAHIATEKFVQGTPLYRQEQQWERFGIRLSRQTMSNRLMKAGYNYLVLVYQYMITQLLKRDILRADETPLQVLKEDGRTKSYMWLYRTGCESADSIVIYRYERNRKQERPQNFLDGFQGYLHCDGYAAYRTLPPDIIPVGC